MCSQLSSIPDRYVPGAKCFKKHIQSPVDWSTTWPPSTWTDVKLQWNLGAISWKQKKKSPDQRQPLEICLQINRWILAPIVQVTQWYSDFTAFGQLWSEIAMWEKWLNSQQRSKLVPHVGATSQQNQFFMKRQDESRLILIWLKPFYTKHSSTQA